MTVTNTWAEGLNPTYAPMTDEQSKTFISAVLIEVQKKDIPEVNDIFGVQILNKRLEVMKLPIHFTDPAKLASMAMADTPGAIVTILIDCLNAFEGKTVTTEDIANLYPVGFYTPESLEKYIDGYLKTRKVKWAELY